MCIGGGALNNSEIEEDNPLEFKPHEYEIVKGGNSINYKYSPSVDAKSTPTLVYEYCVGSSMDEVMAVNLKRIEAPNVTLSYAYKLNTPIDESETLTTQAEWELQTLQNKGDKVYIYIAVTPKDENIQSNYITSVVFYLGKLGQLNYNVNGVNYTKPIVKGQQLNEIDLAMPQDILLKDCYYDEACTKPVTFPINDERPKLYTKTLDRNTVLYGKNGTTDSEGYTLYGAYPQDYVGDALNTTLKNELANNTLVPTGYSYTTDINGTAVKLPEYVYENECYAYLESAKTYSTSYTFNTDTSVTIGNGNAYFFKVEPLRWTNNNGTYLCEYVIGSRPFDPYYYYDEDAGVAHCITKWEDSTIRTYLNEIFYIESGLSQFKTTVTTILNNTASSNVDGSGESTQDYVWLPSYQEITTWYTDITSRRKNCSDLAKATYISWVSDYSTSYYWTRSALPDYYVSGVYGSGYVYDLSSFDTFRGVRPCFSLDRNDTLYGLNGLVDSEGYTLYGAYPQDYVGDTLNTTLKNALSAGTLTASGYSYTTDIAGTSTTLPEYVYNGNYYAYLASSKVYDTSYTFNTDTTITIGDGNAYFFKVEPLRWTNHNDTYLCEYSIGSSRFGAEGITLWENSELRTYLNEVFYIESGISLIKKNKTSIQNNTIKGEIGSYPGTPTEDYIWLPSYKEMVTWYSDSTLRRKVCSDLAKATYIYWYDSYGSSYYWPRSAYSDDLVYIVSRYGDVLTSDPCDTRSGICPCFSLD